RAVVKYFGPGKNLTDKVKVQAFHNAAFSGMPVAEYTLAGGNLAAVTNTANVVTNAIICGLAPSAEAGDYYLRAYIDSNGNNVRDVWESWGYANFYGVSDKPFDPRPVTVQFVPLAESPTVTILSEDADTDQDWFPDIYEYETNPGVGFLSKSGPSTGSDGDPDFEINPNLGDTTGINTLFSALMLGSTDADGDEVGDLAELILGSDGQKVSTSGDGVSDGLKIGLGLSPADTLALEMTGLELTGSEATLTWKLVVDQAEGVNRNLIKSLAGAPGPATYEVLFKPSLDAADWQVVATGTATLSESEEGVSAAISRVQQALQDAPTQGFFRVRLVE
ncbi:MAG TPA: hypothetical protein PLH01_05895, partial [Kiritimatiellia bacterium]|nr:hypothetical protein [Kiritimatiellia bacterium]